MASMNGLETAGPKAAKRAAILDLLRLLPEAGWWTVSAVAVVTLLVGLVGPLQIIVSGRLIAVTARNMGAGTGRELAIWVSVLAVLLAATEVGTPLLTVVANRVGARVDQALQQRVMTAAGGPAGIGHLEVLSRQTSHMRRAEYLRDLALTPAAAKEVRVFGLSGWLTRQFQAEWISGMTQVWRDRAQGWTPLTLATLLVAGLTLAALFSAGLAAVAGHVGLGTLTIVLRSVVRVASGVPPNNVDNQIAYGAAALPALLSFEAACASAASREVAAQAGGTTVPEGDIVLSGVSFAYPGGPPILRQLDLRISAGRSLALVGANGAGKSTLVKVLCRLVEPTAGRVEVGGMDLVHFPPSAWQRRIAPMFQGFLRYDASIRENITFGAVDSSYERKLLDDVARRAGLLGRIHTLPGGWGTPLASRLPGGVDLSGGEWQRVALARALLAVQAGATLMVMDEPTANLDVRAEAEFYDHFFELTAGTTTLVISHRFASVRKADLIGVLENGRIAELGPMTN